MTATLHVDDLVTLAGVDPDEMARREALHLAVQEGRSEVLPLLGGGTLTPEQEAGLPAGRGLGEEWGSDEITLLNGLRGAACAMNGGSDATPSIRANLGVGIAATPFGVTYEHFDDKMPWVTGHVALETLDDFDADACPLGTVCETAIARSRYLAEHLAGSGITPFCFDTQSPFDVAHLVVGDDIFYAMYDEPERVHQLLDNCTRMIIRLTRAYKDATGERPDGGRHGNFAMRGGVRVCEDTVTLLNEEQVATCCVPYTRRLLQAFGGGWIHYCGKNDHLYRAVLDDLPECYALNFGNPEMHDMEQVVADCISRGKTYKGGIPRQADEPLEAYFRRVQGYTQGTGRGLLFACGTNEDGAVALWRRLQGA